MRWRFSFHAHRALMVGHVVVVGHVSVMSRLIRSRFVALDMSHRSGGIPSALNEKNRESFLPRRFAFPIGTSFPNRYSPSFK